MIVPLRRKDPIFGKETPILFAHRGGAKEVEESTSKGFRHAINIGAEVLELDVHVLTDGEIVVWHGPELSNVYIKGKPPFVAERSAEENDIRSYAWKDLQGQAWVAHPDQVPEDLSRIPQGQDNAMLLLDEFLNEFSECDCNIEMKDSFRLNDVEKFVKLLDRHRNKRSILVVSLKESLMDEFRRLTRNYERPYPTGLSMWGVAWSFFIGVLPWVHNKKLDGVALQTSHAWYLSPQRVIDDVHAAGGAVHVFLTNFPILAGPIDAEKGRPTRDELFDILNRGVDGIMTDRPEDVRKLIDQWKQLHPFP
jgi:glycerophosphoryl diester phosphodiesterase